MPKLSISEWAENRQIHEPLVFIHTSRQFAGDIALGLLACVGNFQMACVGSGSN